jgi:hypothetical protein
VIGLVVVVEYTSTSGATAEGGLRAVYTCVLIRHDAVAYTG